MLGIGIDTGGTYTDAVIYDLEKKEILASGKAVTTREQLEIGIQGVLERLPEALLHQAEFLSLSTTLATNACVEGKGGRAKLVFIGVEEAMLEGSSTAYGLPDKSEIYFLEGDAAKPESGKPDWERLEADCERILTGYDSCAVVQIHPRHNGGAYERQARDLILRKKKIPCVLGYDLFQDFNVVRRGASALLNARLIPVMEEFFAAMEKALGLFQLQIPMVIVRSDGSLMSKEFAKERPAETLLCGPAASIMGCVELAREENAVIVDMGGTTSDIALVKNGLPVRVSEGIQIGAWKTFVKGLFVDTFGLGGDSCVCRRGRELYLDTRRVIPLCHLASVYPSVREELQKLAETGRGHSLGLHEYFVLQKEPAQEKGYSEAELRLCAALKKGPLSLEKAAAAAGRDVYTFRPFRLLEEGVIQKAGLTPTDAMHIKGDYPCFDAAASMAAAAFVAASARRSVEALADEIYELVQKKLYCNLVRILLADSMKGKKLDGETLEALTEKSYAAALAEEKPFFSPAFQTNAVLVGAGAPIHIFLPQVAGLLGTRAIMPDCASVANAVGAVAGNVAAFHTVELRPCATEDKAEAYQVVTREGMQVFEEYEEALAAAGEEAVRGAEEKARRMGAKGELQTTWECRRTDADINGGSLFLGAQVVGKSVGTPFS